MGFDERFIRMWEYYLALERGGLRDGHLAGPPDRLREAPRPRSLRLGLRALQGPGKEHEQVPARDTEDQREPDDERPRRLPGPQPEHDRQEDDPGNDLQDDGQAVTAAHA